MRLHRGVGGAGGARLALRARVLLRASAALIAGIELPAGAALLTSAPILAAAPASAFELPAATCSNRASPPKELLTAPIPEVRRRVEALSETDPNASVDILCATIPRVAREYGEDSPELAWWVGSLTMPMIAYMDQFTQAKPLLQFAQPILERAYGADAEQLADIHVAYAWIHTREGHYADAEQDWERALAIRRRFPGVKKIELQKALVGLALVQLNQGKLYEARVTVEEAHRIAVEYHEEVSEAAAAIENILTNVSMREENFQEAKRHVEAQLAIEKQLQAGIGQFVPGYVLLGQILERLNDFAGSEAASREAIRLAETAHGGPLQRHHLTALTQLAILLDARGRPREALEFAQRARELGERTLGPDAPRMVKVLQAVADTQRALGELPEAWHVYERIDLIVQRDAADIERPVRVAYYRGRAGLELELGNRDDAVSALTAGLAAAEPEPALVLQRAYLMATLAQVSALSDVSRARGEFTEARRLFEMRLPESHPAILRVVNETCALEIASRALPESCRAAQRRLASAVELEPALRAAVYGNLSELEQSQAHLAAASRYAESAVAAAEGAGTPQPLWRAYFRTAQVLRAGSQGDLAVFFGKRAITSIERERARFVGEDERFDSGFLRDKVAAYRSVADWLLDAGRIDEAIEVMHLLKAQELAEFVSRAAPLRTEEPGPHLTAAEQALAKRYTGALPAIAGTGEEIDRLSRMQDRGRITASEGARLEALTRREREREAQTARSIGEFMRRNRTVPAAAPPARSIEAARLRAQVEAAPPHTEVAYLLLTEHALRIVMGNRELQREMALPTDAPQLRRRIGEFLEDISERKDVSAGARALYDAVARPVDELARGAGVTRLVLWLDGPLRYMPFGALLSPDGYLADRYAIEITARGGEATDRAAGGPDARVRGDSNARMAGARMTSAAPEPADKVPETERSIGRAPAASAGHPVVRGLGVTQAVAGFPALPAMADELCYIVRGPIAGMASASPACSPAEGVHGALDGEGFADRAFTAERLLELLHGPREFSVLHLGTHFSLRPGNINRSFLVLGDGSRLTLDALGALDFSGLDLVTLSACQTAMGGGRTEDGREIEGLSAVVQQRGARRVVASLWQVEDKSTAELMRVLYQRFAEQQSDPAEALREAQRAVRALTVGGKHPYAQPYFWAGFLVSGG
jgi:CHAT domain-containing protein/tetratricopeptide (TPR) repeat protein